ncbi:MAG: LCP family protein [Lachnospiraceae bacterium]|nr:LCP family protein [Lachnospiraceae bacterium]
MSKKASNGRSIDDFIEEQNRRKKGGSDLRQAPHQDGSEARRESYREPQEIRRGSYDDGNGGGRGGEPKKRKRKLGIILVIIQLVLSVLVMGMLFMLNMFPTKYLIIGGAVLAVLWIIALVTQFSKGKAHIVGKIISIAVCVLIAVAMYYVLITNNMLSAITKSGKNTYNIAAAVREDDPAQSIYDAAGYSFGIQTRYSREQVDEAIEGINKDLGTQINVVVYDSALDMVNGLMSGNVDAIIYNTNLDSTLDELYGGDKPFSESIRILTNIKIETQEEETENARSVEDVAEDCFAIYISGNDTYELSELGRSDVNIIAFVNPNSKQVLLVSTPRDYYLTFPGVTGDSRDKLTHAGWYGIECSMDTLEQLYGCEINYNIKVNFNAVIKMVDSLGGVTVNNEIAFTSNAGIYFPQGEVYMDGKTALEYVRERKHIASGDNQRGRNQMAVLSAMIDKAMSPSIITSYASIMSEMSDCMVTSMTDSEIKKFVKMQLDDGGSWNVKSVNATGFNSNDYCYTLGAYSYVMEPDSESINAIKTQIDALYRGEVLSE